jgi:MYXO-CTERM domain-containing protein
MKKLLLTLITFAFVSVSQAAIIQFDLIGTGGAGLLSTSETAPIVGGGSGGEFGAGIFFDNVAKTLTINVNWGSANGAYNNLSGVSTNAHIHNSGFPLGNAGAGNFLAASGVMIGLQTATAQFTTNTSASAGSITGTSLALSAANEAALLSGATYLNIHTSANINGEMRGFLVQVPEPTTGLLGLGTLGLLTLRRRRA